MCFQRPNIYGIRWDKRDEEGYHTTLFEYKSYNKLTKDDMHLIKNELNYINYSKIHHYHFYFYKKYYKKTKKCFCFCKKEYFLKWKQISHEDLCKII